MEKYNTLNFSPSNIKLLSMIKENSTILEFGPAYGVMTKHLKNDYGCTVYCVEIDSKSADIVRECCEDILVDDIENYKWLDKYKNINFDYIVFADVLEHLYDPWKVILECKNLLNSSGKVLISIPNIAHNAIIMNLFKNEFNYNQLGLLDNTHIRFFTKSGIDSLVTNAGYNVDIIDAIYKEPQYTEFNQKYSNFGFFTAISFFFVIMLMSTNLFIK